MSDVSLSTLAIGTDMPANENMPPVTSATLQAVPVPVTIAEPFDTETVPAE
ncbi:hypothetical protein GCM10010837_18570 [Aminobacter niigataensis]